MRNILTIAINDLLIYFSDRSNLVGLVLIPAALTLVLGFAFGSQGDGPQQVRIDVLDLDESALSEQFLDELRGINSTLVLCPDDNTEDDFCRLDEEQLTLESAITRVEERSTNALIVIPGGYEENIQNFQPVTLDYYSVENALAPSAILQSINAALESINGSVVAAEVASDIGDNFGDGSIFADSEDRAEFSSTVFENASQLWAEEPVSIQYVLTDQSEQPVSLNQTQGFGQSVPGMGSMYVLFTVLGGMVLLIRERNRWTLQRMVVMPISKAEILGGKMLAYFTLGMIQFAVVFVVGLVTGTDFGNAPFALLLIAVAYVLCVTALTFALGTRVTKEAQASGLVTLLALTLAPLGGAWFPSEIMPQFMQTIGRISPISWAMEGFRDVIFFGGGLNGIVLVDIAVLLVAAVVLFFIGIRGFRYE